MKKTITLLIMATVLFASCTTNPITKDNFNPNNRPASPTFLTYLIPGLPQFLMGEYLEAAAYFSLFAFTTYDYIFMPGVSASVSETDYRKEMLAGVGLSYLIGSWDGIVSDSDRVQAWVRYSKFGVISDQQMLKLKEDEMVESLRKNIDYQFIDNYNDNLIKVEYVALNGSTPGLLMGDGNIQVRIISNYDKPLSINWGKSYINYSKGQDPIFVGSYSVIRNTPNIQSQVIMPKNIISVNIFGVSQILSQFDYSRFPSKNFDLVLCIEKEGAERYYQIVTIIK